MSDGNSEILKIDNCNICGTKIQFRVFEKQICSTCGYKLFRKMATIIDRLDADIIDMYNITEITTDNIPVLTCNCDADSILPIDYYTPKSDTHSFYDLVVCGLCRSCTGYRKETMKGVKIPFRLKERPSHVGIDVNMFKPESINKEVNLGYFN